MPGLPPHHVLCRAERAVALLGRCRPRNAQPEAERLNRCWLAGDRCAPRWSYAPVPDLSELRRALGALVEQVRAPPELRGLFADRVAELVLESRLVEAIGRSTAMSELSRTRFEPEFGFLKEADALAHGWVDLKPGLVHAASVSDDERDPHSLVSRMRAAVGLARLPFRVQVSDELISAAATGEGVILVAAGRRLFANEVARIVEHEVHGHAWPRARAHRQRNSLFASGSAQGNDVQEGYALLREQRHGSLDAHRRKELALRHLAARTVWSGATWVETTKALIEWGAALPVAIQISSRVHRAGGLAREVVYLPAYCAVQSASQADPSVLDWLAAGRLSFRAIDVLRKTGVELIG